MSKFKKHQMILPRLAFDLPSIQKNLSRITNANGYTYDIINAYGQTAQVSKVEVDTKWFSVFSKDKTLAPYESLVTMTAVLNPGATVSQLLAVNPTLGSTQKINSALERIRSKGFPFIDNFISEVY